MDMAVNVEKMPVRYFLLNVVMKRDDAIIDKIKRCRDQKSCEATIEHQ